MAAAQMKAPEGGPSSSRQMPRSVAPGLTRTEGLEASLNTPESLAAAVDHSGETDDPAAALIFLLSDGGTYISGTTICVVGGGFDAPVPLKASAN
jgi:hypothetical protein